MDFKFHAALSLRSLIVNNCHRPTVFASGFTACLSMNHQSNRQYLCCVNSRRCALYIIASWKEKKLIVGSCHSGGLLRVRLL